MWRTFIKHSDVVYYEPVIAKYIPDTTPFISRSSEMIMQKVQAKDIKLRQILIPLDLVLNAAEEDEFERMRFVVNLSAAVVTTGITYSLNGCNTEDGTFLSVATITYSANEYGEKSVVFTKSYKFYKVTANYTGVLTECFLVETSFDLCLIFCSLWLAFNSLVKTPNDVWSGKSLDYQQMFNDTYSELNFRVDKDESGDYDTNEQSETIVTRLLI